MWSYKEIICEVIRRDYMWSYIEEIICEVIRRDYMWSYKKRLYVKL